MQRYQLGLFVKLGFVLMLITPGFAAISPSDAVRSLVRHSVQAMGGEERLRGLHSMSFKGIGHRYMLEQSERPEGPWLLDYFQISEERDLDRGRIRRETKSRGCDSTECWKSAEWDPSTLIVADHVAARLNEGKTSAGQPSAVQLAEESLALAPDRVLLLPCELSPASARWWYISPVKKCSTAATHFNADVPANSSCPKRFRNLSMWLTGKSWRS